MQGWSDMQVDEHGFKARRRDNFGGLLNSKVTAVYPATLGGEDRLCPICTGTLGEADVPDPVALPCSIKHVICKGCILSWIDSQGPDKASCPRCRERVFDNQQEIDDLKFGLINGVYELDERYTAYENFERSCADLDQELAEGDMSWFTVTADLFIRVWDILLDGVLLEEYNGSTAEYLNPALSEEWDLADDEFRLQAFKFDGVGVCTRRFFEEMVERVYGAFVGEFRKNGMHGYISGDETDQLARDPANAECLNIRPGFKECFKRQLNRTLRFLQLRKCGCTPGLHKHGLRDYYDPNNIHAYAGANKHRNCIDGDGDVDMEGC